MRLGALIAVVLLLAGCVSSSGVSHFVPAYPTNGQSPAMIERDKEACDQVAMKHPHQIAYQFVCLTARGYRTYVPS